MEKDINSLNSRLESARKFQDLAFKSKLKDYLDLKIEERKEANTKLSFNISQLFKNKFLFGAFYGIAGIVVAALCYPSIAYAIEECGADLSCYPKIWFTTNNYGKEVEVQVDGDTSIGLGLAELSYDNIIEIFDDMNGKYVKKTSDTVAYKLEETDNILYAYKDETGSWYIDPSQLDLIESNKLSKLMYGDSYNLIASHQPDYYRINKSVLEKYTIDALMNIIGANYDAEMDGSKYYTIRVNSVEYIIEYTLNGNIINMRLASGGNENGGYIKLNEKPFITVIDKINNLEY